MWVFWLFAAFIVSCGLTHLMEVVTTYVPVYWLAGLIKLETAAVSLATAAYLVPLIPRALALRSPSELEREIEGRKQAQQVLEAQAGKLREQALLLDLAHDGIFVRSLEDRILFWNQGAVEEYGWSKAEAAGQVSHTLLRTVFPEPLTDIRATLLRDGQWEGELTHSHRNGNPVVVASRWVVQRDPKGRPVGVLQIDRDISLRKRAEAELQRANAELQRANAELERRVAERTADLAVAKAHLEAVFHSVQEGIAVFDQQANLSFCNNAQARVMGYAAPAEMLRNLDDFSKVFELTDAREGVLPVEQWPASRVMRGELLRDYQCHGRRRDTGQEWYFSFSGSPVRAEDGQQVLSVVVTRDVTDARRAEEALRDASRRKDEFLATLAHELRNPLAPIVNCLQLLRGSGIEATMLEQARSILERQVEQMVRLVDDLLDVSRISRGKLQLRAERVELGPVLTQAIEQARPNADGPGHQLRAPVLHEPIHLQADPLRLVQVFSNLLNNACKFTPPGGSIEVAVGREGNDAVVSIRDTGMGIPRDKLDRVFEMFIQLEQSPGRLKSGLGLGLTLVKQLVELHGGIVEAHSEGAGKGSTFVVRLPMHPEPGLLESGQATEDGEQKSVAPIRILVADDNRDAADSLAALLRANANMVRTAYDGQEAFEAAESMKPDVALVDIGMPKLNGYQLARKIREQPWGKKVMLVAVTGWGNEEDRRKSMEGGFNAHLVKPVEYEVLLSLLARWQAEAAGSGRS